MAKNLEKIDVFWDLDLEGILGGFWEGFGRPKTSIFALFWMFFRCHFLSAVRKAKKSTKNAKKPNFSAFWRRVCGGDRVVPRLLGKGKDKGKNTSGRIARKNIEIGQLRFDRASWK